MKKELMDACYWAGTEEACGFIADGRVIHVPNRHADEGAFRIIAAEAESILRAEGLGPDDIVAVWHTHPSGNLVASETDLAAHPWAFALVIATCEAVRIYRAQPA